MAKIQNMYCLLIVLLTSINYHLISTKSAIAADKKVAHKPDVEKGMVLIPSGIFWMGSEQFQDTKPIHRVHIDQFLLDKTEVTNEMFSRFVSETGYKTIAERSAKLDREENQKRSKYPGGLVFIHKDSQPSKSVRESGWTLIAGADWRHPEGPSSDIRRKKHHPVVQVAWEDAMAYAKWANKRLPSEAEFEFASRGGLDRKSYCWGDYESAKHKRHYANIWQGSFPFQNTKLDGFDTTAPVATYPQNGYGVFDMCGNVWEWCSDWYDATYFQTFDAESVADNPAGPNKSLDPNEPEIAKRVLRGGSFLCSENYCLKYKVGARNKGALGTSWYHVGFRCAKTLD